VTLTILQECNVFKLPLLIFSLAVMIAGCSSTNVATTDIGGVGSERRFPAGTGDIDSSSGNTSAVQLDSYKLPITRDSKTTTRIAYNFWSGEWPGPAIDVFSDLKGETKISAYKNLRNPSAADRVDCTIKNGVYHPWSKTDGSAINYYTLWPVEDYKVIKKIVFNPNDVYVGGKTRKLTLPVGTLLLNLVPYAENYCGVTMKIGKNVRPLEGYCPIFTENPSIVRTTPDTDDSFIEQWIYLSCQEKGTDGKPLKAFVKDTDLLAQPGIIQGCPTEYGSVGGGKVCKEK
jgi:hypothetical protein